MKRLVATFLGASALLSVAAHGQISLPWPGPGLTSGVAVADCTFSGSSGSFTVTTVGAFRYYVFSGTTTGTSTVTCPTSRNLDILVIGSGGGGNATRQGSGAGAGGGGAGEYCTQAGYAVTAGDAIQITVPAGGAGATVDGGPGTDGAATVWNATALHGSTISAHGGGGAAFGAGHTGGSGGGAGNNGTAGPTSQTCGGNVNVGGTSVGSGGSGGGGAASPGTNSASATVAGNGGNGITWIDNVARAGGGGGGSQSGTQGIGGTGGGGNGTSTASAGDATANTGSGGGGRTPTTPGVGSPAGAGGSGAIVFRHSIGTITAFCSTTGTVTLDQTTTNTVYKFTGNGTLTCPSAVQAQYVLVAGGGSGVSATASSGGPGGAGGVRAGVVQLGTQIYNITIGAGGTAPAPSDTTVGATGQNSQFDIIATARGGGGGSPAQAVAAGSGGSGGGNVSSGGTAGQGVAGQGYAGGTGGTAGWGGGGGGGATGPGTNGNAASGSGTSGNGGPGYQVSAATFGTIGVSGCVAGGGGGPHYQNASIGTAVCGGGLGAAVTPGAGAAGAANTGGGGGGGNGSGGSGGNGGSGILVVSHPTALTNVCVANTQGGGTDANVVGLWHMDQMTNDASGSGANGTLNGGAVFSTTQQQFGGYSLRIPTTATDFMSFPGTSLVLPASGNFTVEAWQYLPSLGIYGWFGDDNATNIIGAAIPQWNLSVASVSASTTATISGTATANVFQHVVWERSGTQFRFFLNGTEVAGSPAAGASTAIAGGSATAWKIGRGSTSTYVPPSGSFFDEVRVSNAVRYTSNFTPNTQPFCDPVASPIQAPTLIAQSGLITTTGTTGTTTTTAPIVAGNFVAIAVAQQFPAAPTINSITINDGTNPQLNLTQAIRNSYASGGYNDIWYATNVTQVNSGATVQVNYSVATGASSFQHIVGVQASGVSLTAPTTVCTGPCDKTAGATSGATTAPVTIPALTTAPELILCYGQTATGTALGYTIPDPNYTNLFTGFFASANNKNVRLDWRAVTNPASTTWNPTLGAAATFTLNTCATFIHG